jgi:hypothetical protein
MTNIVIPVRFSVSFQSQFGSLSLTKGLQFLRAAGFHTRCDMVAVSWRLRVGRRLTLSVEGHPRTPGSFQMAGTFCVLDAFAKINESVQET